MSEVTGLPF